MVRMPCLPVFSGTQMRDVRDMVARVPCISERQQLHRHRAILWMMAPAFPLLVVERLQQHHPAGMQAFHKLQRPLHGSRDVVQLRPGRFIVWFDRRPVFGQRKLDADDGVHMTVRDVVHNLPQSPPTLAVRCAQLRKAQPIHRIPQLLRKLGQRCNRISALAGRDGRRRRKAANRVPRVHIVQGHVRLLTPLLCNVAHGLCNLYFSIRFLYGSRNSLMRLLATSLPVLLLLAAAGCAQQTSPAPASHTPSGTTQNPIGFDSNDYPGDDALPALRRHFAFAGYWLTNPPGEHQNGWRGKRDVLLKNDFGFLVLANGKFDAEIKKARRSGTSPATLGKKDAAAAVAAPQCGTSASRSPPNISIQSRSGSIRTPARHPMAAPCNPRLSPPAERRTSRHGSTHSLRAAKRSLPHAARPTPPTATATSPTCLNSCSISASQAHPIPHTDAESPWCNSGQSSDKRTDHANFCGPSATPPFAAALREA